MPEAKKVVVKVEVHNDKEKRKAMKKVSTLLGIESLAMDMNDKKLTVIGDVDPVCIVEKLKKCFHAEIATVGPAKEEKKDEKKEEKKDEKKDGDKDNKEEEDLCACRAYNTYMTPPHYCVYSIDESPSGCVIC